eukprot:scaffold55306_cov64-Phaeocystis_antarctica.AAC.2
MEPLAAWRKRRRHWYDEALRALSADERRRVVPQGRRVPAAVRDRQPRRRARGTDTLETVSSHPARTSAGRQLQPLSGL